MVGCKEGEGKTENQPEALKGLEGVKSGTHKYSTRDIAPVGALNICSCSGLIGERLFGSWRGRSPALFGRENHLGQRAKGMMISIPTWASGRRG